MPREFRLVRTLGRGAHGAVHLAEMRDEDDYVQPLAVKRLLPEWSHDPDLVARLKDEARLLALLRHEHVVRVHGLTRIDGALAILMEPVDGVDLGRLGVQHGALQPRVALEIVRAVADALDAAWNTAPDGRDPLRVVHRDIKPSNVMVTARGGVKVMDFGVARATFESREGETRSQQFGTARYMAPERWLHGQAEHRSDVFSLGVTLIEIAGGAPVARFRLSPDGFAEDLAAVTQDLAWAPLRELAVSMASFVADERPSAAEVVTRVEQLLALAPGPTLRAWAATAVVPELGEAVDPTATATLVREDTASRSAGAPLPPRRRWPLAAWGVVGLGAFALLSGIGLSAALLNGPLPSPEPIVAAPPPSPTPLPEPEPEPEPEPAPPPAPSPVEPVVLQPAPTLAPAPPPIAPEPLPEATVWFALAPGIVVVVPDGRRITQRHTALALPTGQTLELVVEDGDARSSCTVQFSGSTGKVTIEAGGRCSQY